MLAQVPRPTARSSPPTARRPGVGCGSITLSTIADAAFGLTCSTRCRAGAWSSPTSRPTPAPRRPGLKKVQLDLTRSTASASPTRAEFAKAVAGLKGPVTLETDQGPVVVTVRNRSGTADRSGLPPDEPSCTMVELACDPLSRIVSGAFRAPAGPHGQTHRTKTLTSPDLAPLIHENRRTPRSLPRLLRLQGLRPQAQRRARAQTTRPCCSRRPG